MLHDQRAAESLLTIQQWARECHAAHVRASAAVPKGATAIGNMLLARFGDPPGGHISASSDVMEILLALRKERDSKFVAFHRGTGQTIPLCQLSSNTLDLVPDALQGNATVRRMGTGSLVVEGKRGTTEHHGQDGKNELTLDLVA
ncbi:hypothetical protein CYMTET_42033 [Cymbomonas tetramitiformis]|uniref:Uncharacterized protein n=1 Tax=Cymbomonas tetramitiformis TaxID=36881 RepID=A0AAE0C612_9CHLO|nr:hypothetical protein CYMTET_42033 [Cymbomonas tetramitiformis]